MEPGSVHPEASVFSSPHEPDNTRVHVNVLVCTICLAPPTDAVVTVCGHLFCWPCLYEWLHQAQSKTCPFCRIELREDISITPVYGSPEIGTTSSAAEGAINIPGTVPKSPAPPFVMGSSLESLENLNVSGPDSSRFVFRSVALEEVKTWKKKCEKLQTLLHMHKGRIHTLERQLNRADRRRLERGEEARGATSE